MENESVWGDYGTVLYLDYDSDYITVWVFQTSRIAPETGDSYYMQIKPQFKNVKKLIVLINCFYTLCEILLNWLHLLQILLPPLICLVNFPPSLTA